MTRKCLDTRPLIRTAGQGESKYKRGWNHKMKMHTEIVGSKNSNMKKDFYCIIHMEKAGKAVNAVNVVEAAPDQKKQ